MDKPIDHVTVSELAFALLRHNVAWNIQVNGQKTTITDIDKLEKEIQRLSLRKLYDYLSQIVDNGVRNSFLIILMRYELKYANNTIVEQKNHIDNLSKQVAEMDDNVKTLNEKMAVLIDALSTLDPKN